MAKGTIKTSFKPKFKSTGFKKMIDTKMNKTQFGYGNDEIGRYRTKRQARRAFNKKVATDWFSGKEAKQMQTMKAKKQAHLTNQAIKASVGLQAANLIGKGAEAIGATSRVEEKKLDVADRFLQTALSNKKTGSTNTTSKPQSGDKTSSSMSEWL